MNGSDWGNTEGIPVFHTASLMRESLLRPMGEEVLKTSSLFIGRHEKTPPLKRFLYWPGKKKKKKKLSQLRLWIVKQPTDAAAGKNGAVARERLQRPQEEEDLVVPRFSLGKGGLSFQPAREGQGQRSTQGGLPSYS